MIVIMSEDLSQLFVKSISRNLDSGEPLFHAGDPVLVMAMVNKGRIDLTRQTAAGGTIVLQRAGQGEVVSEASAYSARYHCDARAGAASRVSLIPVPEFRRRLVADPALGDIWAAYLARSVQTTRLRAEIRSLRTVGERLGAWLGASGELPEKGRWQDLAEELGITREALYRELARRRASRRVSS